MIAKEIYLGKTAEDLGLTYTQYASRKETLDKFLAQWDGEAFEASYLAWLDKTQSGQTAPGIAAIAKSFSSAVIGAAQTGFSMVDDRVASARINACVECEYMRSDRCMVCGCFTKVKAKFGGMDCPRGLWEE